MAAPLTLSFGDIEAARLLVGGKAANLGVLTRAGLPVPPGLCITTEAYRRVTDGAGLGGARRAGRGARSGPAQRAGRAGPQARAGGAGPRRHRPGRAAQRHRPGRGPVVGHRRGLAGRQLRGPAGHLPERGGRRRGAGCGPALLGLALDGPAVAYRAANRIDHRAVRLAVVIQDMVQSQVAGVMFTANPVTGVTRP